MSSEDNDLTCLSKLLGGVLKVHIPRPSPEYLMQDLRGLCGFQARECFPERKLNKDSLNDE